MDMTLCGLMPTMRPSRATVMAIVATMAVSQPAWSQVVTRYAYDAGDHVSQVTDPRGLVTTYTYDGLGQKWQQVSPDTGTTSYAYDGYGRLASTTRANGAVTSFGYDAIDRLTSVSAGGLTQTFTFDSCTNGIGRLCKASDNTGVTTYFYSPEGWVTGRGFSMGGTTYSLGYGYNTLGQVNAVVYPDGNQALYTYSNGVVSNVQIKVGSVTTNVATGISYLPNDAGMTQWMAGNGLGNSFGFDTDGRLISIWVPGIQSLTFNYDAADRLTGIVNGMDAAMSQSFGYGQMSRVASVYSDADNETFQNDQAGNRVSQTINGVSATFTPSSSSNRLVSISGGTNTTYGYDANGNVTTVSGTPTFTYDAFNRLSSAGGASYYVSPEGQRLRKTVNGTSTYFAPGGLGMLAAENSGAGWNDYLWLNGRLIGRVVNGQLQAIHTDGLGRPEAVTDANRNVVWRARNFAFDRTVTLSTSAPLNIGFPGQYFDAESGLWNNGFRDYSPSLGRYIESDPLGLKAGINTYIYVGGNPLINVDPLGTTNVTIGPNVSVIAAGGFTLGAGVYVSFGSSEGFDIGLYGSAGMGVGVNVGAGINGGYSPGGPSNISGTTVDVSGNGAIFQGSASVSTDGVVSGTGGIAAGLPVGAALTTTHTGHIGLQDAVKFFKKLMSGEVAQDCP